MQLPAWVHSGNEVWYVYEEGGRRKMEVYDVGVDKYVFVRSGECGELEDWRRLPKFISQWLDRKRIASFL